MTHTPTPWTVDGVWIESAGDTIAEVWVDANAAFIVRACNSHDELLAALKAIVGLANETIDGAGIHYTFDLRSPLADAARAAIARAEN